VDEREMAYRHMTAVHEQRLAMFSHLIEPGETPWETSAATMVEGLGWPSIPKTLDPYSDLVVTDRQLLYRDVRGHAEIPWGRVVGWRAKQAGRFGMMKHLIFLDLRLHDGEVLRFACNKPFAAIWQRWLIEHGITDKS